MTGCVAFYLMVAVVVAFCAAVTHAAARYEPELRRAAARVFLLAWVWPVLLAGGVAHGLRVMWRDADL